MSEWKAYPDVKRTASNAYDADQLNYPVEESVAILKAIERGIRMERERCATIAEKIQGHSDDYNGAYDGIADVIDSIRRDAQNAE